MTISPAAVWNIMKAGSDTNGGGYDATIAGAGTDYSLVATAQLSLSDIACVGGGSKTVTSVTGGFTSAMIGNAIFLTGGGATTRAYFITAVGSTNSITTDDPPGTITAGNGKVGGAWLTYYTNTISHTNVQPGNTIRIQGSGTTKPTTDDYAKSSGFIQILGDTINGNIKIIGYNGYPRIASNGLIFFACNQLWLENLYLSANGTSYASPYGMINNPSAPSSGPQSGCCYLINCTVDQNGHDAGGVTGSWTIIGGEIFDRVSTGSAGTIPALDGISGQGFGMQIVYTNIHNTRGPGVRLSNHLGNHITDSIISNCRSHGLTFDSSSQGTDAGSNGAINVTIDANLGDGIHFNGPNGLQEATIFNCLITNHVTASTYGMNATAAGATALNNRLAGFINWNAYYGNTAGGNFNAISAGANDIIGTDPVYAAQATEGYNISTPLKAAGFPQGPFLQSAAGKTATQMYVDMGGVQRQEGAP